MIIFDASYLIPYLHPDPEPPKDRADKPVEKFRERISQLIAELNAGGQIIGVPTPALAEILVRAGKGKFRYLQTIGDAYRFEVLPFDQRAAIDAGELIALIKKEVRQPLTTWAKIKFDIQIAAIGKTVGAATIYSDDTQIEAHGKRLNIPVIRICDLPLPPEPVEPKKVAIDDFGQGKLALTPVVEDLDEKANGENSAEPIHAENPPELRADDTGGAGDSPGTEAKGTPEAGITEAKGQPAAEAVTPAPGLASEKPKAANKGGPSVDGP